MYVCINSLKMLSSFHCENNNENFTPVIGILCIDIASALEQTYDNEYNSYIAASYVKYLESAGARVVPIWIDRPRSYYVDIMSKINGILFPGGAVFFDTKYCREDIRSDCVQSSKFIYEIAKELNEQGVHFPLWGTCMGFQLMLTHSADQIDIRQDCTNMKCCLPIKFESDEVVASSKIFGHINETLKVKMSTLPFGFHYHRYCITKQDLEMFKIAQQWKVLACNEDNNGLEFITIVEHKNLPFFGSQIHLERVIFENFDIDAKNLHHCLECFQLAQYFAKFFVQECSQNRNHFVDKAEEQRHIICNFPIVHTAAEKQKWQQCYLFRKDTDYPPKEKN